LTAFEDLGSYGGLICELPPGRAHSLVDRVLGPLRAYDSRYRTRLIATLAEYVRSSGGLQETAAALKVQPRTVRQRLRRCAELSGLDFDDYASLGEVVIAMKFDEILHTRSHGGHSRT
jgi:DNA-binding PucR family transcriptional regulator